LGSVYIRVSFLASKIWSFDYDDGCVDVFGISLHGQDSEEYKTAANVADVGDWNGHFMRDAYFSAICCTTLFAIRKGGDVMGVLVSFTEARSKAGKVQKETVEQQPAWSKYSDPQEVTAFHEYILGSEAWFNDGFWETIYEGYPLVAPCEPVRDDMEWFVDLQSQRYGVWVLNLSGNPIEVKHGHFGWNPFIRKSTAPGFEPINVPSVEKRKNLTWIVDGEGYGQFGLVMSDGTMWVPSPRPTGWVDRFVENNKL
jgi:hypothetical protein